MPVSGIFMPVTHAIGVQVPASEPSVCGPLVRSPVAVRRKRVRFFPYALIQKVDVGKVPQAVCYTAPAQAEQFESVVYRNAYSDVTQWLGRFDCTLREP